MTKQKLFIFLGLFLLSSMMFGQQENVVDVTDQTIKIGALKEKELLFGFAEGDKIIFNFSEIDNKEIKEIEIIEYPSNSKFSDYKTSRVEDKTITISKKGVYIFRFKNTALTGRVCKIKIQRIPSNEDTRNFNTSVTWEAQQEITYNNYTKEVIAGYDTIYSQKTKKVLVKSELSEDMIIDKTERVHSKSNLDYKNCNVVQVVLPQNEIYTYKTKKIVAWAYWIGVGKEATEAWAKNVNTIKNIASGVSTIMGGGPLAGIAIGTVSNLLMPTMGEDVSYWFITDSNNASLFKQQNKQFLQFDKGRGIASYGKNSNLLQGIFYVGLLNDNTFQGIDANIKVSVIWETNYYEDKQYTDMKVTPRYEKRTFSEPLIKTSKIPVIGK